MKISKKWWFTAWRVVLSGSLIVGLLSVVARVSSQTSNDKAAGAGATNAAALAWKEVDKATRPPMPPPEWQTNRPSQEEIQKFREQQGKLAGQAADKARDFYTRF